jgi:predicted nucleic acid-binding protein
VLSEVLSYFSSEGARGREIGAQAARLALRSIEVITPTRTLFERVLDLYAARPDKEYSLVDCMSMVVMRGRGITHVLTKDHHFRQEGFTVLSDAP